MCVYVKERDKEKEGERVMGVVSVSNTLQGSEFIWMSSFLFSVYFKTARPVFITCNIRLIKNSFHGVSCGI